MTDSLPPTRFPTTDAPDPRDDPNLLRTFQGYRKVLSTMTIEQLMAHSVDLAAQLEEQSRRTLMAQLSSPLSSSMQSLDSPVVRSPRMASPSSRPDRGQAASQPSPALPPRSALDLLASSKRLAPRIAAKLVAAEARRAKADRS